MRTLFINPGNPRHKPRRRTKTKRRNIQIKPNAYEKGLAQGIKLANKNPKRKKRSRRNAGVTAFVKQPNPLILNNPPRRRRRRRNARPALTLRSFATDMLSYGGGSAIGASLNIFGLNKIEDMWFRNGARLGLAFLSGALLRGELGAAAAGSTLYPVWQEIALQLLAPTEGDLEADLDTLAADLEDILENVDNDDEYEDVDSYN